ncbi:3-deoxy-7-phosphoheptulonate synthase [Kitasatospora sp. NBC_01539]|uniref:3-deoxy-7-phosphoheptulonate synthase n=1 Tax=Kitasatospora sp. NBC_01539 TaxID=2903577 RepID=UPI0038601770
MSSAPPQRPGLLTAGRPLVWDMLPAEQQPHWRDHSSYAATRRALLEAAPLVLPTEIAELRGQLAAVASGRARLLQAGDCAENLTEQTPRHIAGKISVLNALGDHLAARTGQDVVRIGRIGGQFAKPRSAATERHAGSELPSFRGHMVNAEEPTPEARQHDPRRMLLAYEAAALVSEHLREARHQGAAADSPRIASGPWASHEALVIDYEGPLVRSTPDGREYLASTHLPWIGERTRQPDSAHVDMLSVVQNPVACKIGPTAGPAEVVKLCGLLDPERSPGRLTLILRLGRTRAADVLPGIVDAVRHAGHPVIWAVDPMHGNTEHTQSGIKTRHLRHIAEETTVFLHVLERQGAHPGGLHLETAATDVTECLGAGIRSEDALDRSYTTLCDPRLNPEQAHELIRMLFRS